MSAEPQKQLLARVRLELRAYVSNLNDDIVESGGWTWSRDAIEMAKPDHREPALSHYMAAKRHLENLDEYTQPQLEEIQYLLDEQIRIPEQLKSQIDTSGFDRKNLTKRSLAIHDLLGDLRPLLKKADEGSPESEEIKWVIYALDFLRRVVKDEREGYIGIFSDINKIAGALKTSEAFDEKAIASLGKLEDMTYEFLKDMGAIEEEPEEAPEAETAEGPVPEIEEPVIEKKVIPPQILKEIDRRAESLVFIDERHRESYAEAAAEIMLATIKTTDPEIRGRLIKLLDDIGLYSEMGLWRVARDLGGAPETITIELPEYKRQTTRSDEQIRIQNLYDSVMNRLVLEHSRQSADPDAMNPRTHIGQQVGRLNYKIERLPQTPLNEVEALARVYQMNTDDPPDDGALRLALKEGLEYKLQKDRDNLTPDEFIQMQAEIIEHIHQVQGAMKKPDLLVLAEELGANEEISRWVDISEILEENGIAPFDPRKIIPDDACEEERAELKDVLYIYRNELDKKIREEGGWERSFESLKKEEPDHREPWLNDYYNLEDQMRRLPEMPLDEVWEILFELHGRRDRRAGYRRIQDLVDRVEDQYAALWDQGIENVWASPDAEIEAQVLTFSEDRFRLTEAVRTPAPLLLPWMEEVANYIKLKTVTWVDRIQKLSDDDRVRYQQRGKDNSLYSLRELGTDLVAAFEYATSMAQDHYRRRPIEHSLPESELIPGAEHIRISKSPFKRDTYLRSAIGKIAGEEAIAWNDRIAELRIDVKDKIERHYIKPIQEPLENLPALASDELIELAHRYGIDPYTRPEGAEFRTGVAEGLDKLTARVKRLISTDPGARVFFNPIESFQSNLWFMPAEQVVKKAKALGFVLEK